MSHISTKAAVSSLFNVSLQKILPGAIYNEVYLLCEADNTTAATDRQTEKNSNIKLSLSTNGTRYVQ